MRCFVHLLYSVFTRAVIGVPAAFPTSGDGWFESVVVVSLSPSFDRRSFPVATSFPSFACLSLIILSQQALEQRSSAVLRFIMRFPSLFLTVALARSSIADYVLEDDYSPSKFFDMFNFFSGKDPTHGFGELPADRP